MNRNEARCKLVKLLLYIKYLLLRKTHVFMDKWNSYALGKCI